MISRWIPVVISTLVAPSCSRDGPSGQSAGADARTAFGVASGVTSAPAANGRLARVVPLGRMSGDAEMLFGHPDSAGRPFVMRIRELPGTVVPPHTHPVDEHITVVSGTWYFGTGERFDSTALRELKTGAYAFAPSGTTMFGYSPDGAVVQVHGVGPFHIHWRDSLRVMSEPGGATAFRFAKGDAVESRRGVGRIREGYASGPLIQYEIEGADGALFMVHERELRRR
jgi:quercetin dioxygenase-like cupin family protein